MAVESLVVPISHIAAPGRMSVRVSTGFLEASAQTYLATAPVISSSGKIATAANGFTTGVLGLAAKKAVGTVNSNVDIYPGGGLEFEATLEDQSLGDHVLAQTDLFAQYGMRVTSTGIWYVNFNDTGSKAVTVIERVDKVGTIQGRVRVRFIGTVTLLAQ
jgi:hypothetical protein